MRNSGRPTWRARRVHLDGERLQDVGRRLVGDGVDGVQAQAVAVVVAQPPEGVVHEEGPHGVAVGGVEVDRVAPIGGVPGREVGPELGQVVPGRPQVVVHHVHHHAEPPAVAGVDQPLQALGPPVGVVGREQVDPVVAPPPVPGELGHGQQFDPVDAERHQVVQPLDHGVEGAGRGEGAHVELVQDRAAQRNAAPAAVVPAERGVVDDPGRAVHPVGLPRGAGIGPSGAAIETKLVVAARLRASGACRVHQSRSAAAIGIGCPSSTRSTRCARGAQTRNSPITPPWPAPRRGNAGTGRPR